MNVAADSLVEVAARLTREIGRAPPSALVALTGGKNNRVFRIDMSDGPPLALKSYFSDPRDPRDRLAAEWNFLTYAQSRGVANVPKPQARDTGAHCGLYSFLSGRKLLTEEIEARHVEAAADFVLKINSPPRNATSLLPGSEACFSISQHLETVDRRVARLRRLDPDAPHRVEAQRFIEQQLVPAWAAARRHIESEAHKAGVSLAAELPQQEIIVSPSDFGFHNALVDDNGTLSFLDFEYSGRDDPAKLVCDFFCQPEKAVSLSYFTGFTDRVTAGIQLPDSTKFRCRILLRAYQLKWACIILNDFLPMDATRRSFALASAREQRCAEQIAKARAKITEDAF